MSKRNPANAGKAKPKPEANAAKPARRTGARSAAPQAKANPAPGDAAPNAKAKTNIAHPSTVTAPQAENPTLPTEATMEVHHHPQLEHNPKRWKEYLIEGFMIFIAVMMGFIAENVRETITNNEHVRQLTSRLVQDLKVDTIQMGKQYKAETEVLTSNDALFTLLQQPMAKVDTKNLQELVATSHSMWPFHPSAVAIAAIKNELYLKQFSDSKIISYIAAYEKDIELMRTQQDITLKYQQSLLEPFVLNHFTAANFDAALNRSAKPTAEMRNLTPADLTQLGVSMVLIRINTRGVVTNNRQLLDDAKQLMQYVTEKYQPED